MTKNTVAKVKKTDDMTKALEVLALVSGKLEKEEFEVLSGAIHKNVVALGTDEAFALRDESGEIRAFKQRVFLSVADGTLNELPEPKVGGNWTKIYPISAQGYEVLSEATGTCVIFPDSVIVDGQKKSNPYVSRDEINGRTKSVYARAIAFRFSSKGVPQVADWTTTFDPGLYRMIDLLAKAKRTPQAFRLLPKDMEPEIDDKNPNATWTKYVFDEASNLWVNTSHEEALHWYATIINREKKSVDFAQTFARRNAVKHLLGLQKSPGPTWNVTVLCWRPTSGNIVKWDATKYKQLQDKVGGIIHGTDNFADDKPLIEMQRGKESIEDENGAEEILQQTDPEDQEQVDITPETEPEKKAAPEDEPTPTNEMTQEEAAIIKNLKTSADSFPDEYWQARNNLKLDKGVLISPVNATDIINEMNQILDAQAA